jgi:hypothetical protein
MCLKESTNYTRANYNDYIWLTALVSLSFQIATDKFLNVISTVIMIRNKQKKKKKNKTKKNNYL